MSEGANNVSFVDVSSPSELVGENKVNKIPDDNSTTGDEGDHRVGNSWDDTPVPAALTPKYKPGESFVIDMEEAVYKPPVGKAISQKQANTYAAKKTVAQGMMDIALITANANQLRYILEFYTTSPTYYVNITLIIISLLLQVAIGISLVFKGRFDMRGESKHRNARRINSLVVVAVFLVTIINVFIASFTVTGGTGGALANQANQVQGVVPQAVSSVSNSQVAPTT